ncbi:MAG: hypothetical protein IPF68_19675, partial [Bacteroidales bacterium]|nr:hypothetical protein [Bacteroidales bacterium]
MTDSQQSLKALLRCNILFSFGKCLWLVHQRIHGRLSATITDDFGEYEDWIELYNGGSESQLWLGDKYLSDNLANPSNPQRPDVSRWQQVVLFLPGLMISRNRALSIQIINLIRIWKRSVCLIMRLQD